MENEKSKKEKIFFIVIVILVIIVIAMACNLFVLNGKSINSEKQITDLKNQINELESFIGYEGSEDVILLLQIYQV